MSRLLFATGQNSPSQTPIHYGAITGGSSIKAWHTDTGAIHINSANFRLSGPTCLAITSQHQPSLNSSIKSQPIMAIGTKAGLIHLISLTTGDLLDTLYQTENPSSKSLAHSNKPMEVRDMIWSHDGSILYSISKRHVYQWHVGSQLALHKRYAVFGVLTDHTNKNVGMDEATRQLMNTNSESLHRIALNHNQDKLILGGSTGVFVHDLASNIILAKYYGYPGKVKTLSIDRPPFQYTHQQHHHIIQSQFPINYPHNSATGEFTEFYIAVGNNRDNNVSIYQYPPVNVDSQHQIMIKRSFKDHPTTNTFQLANFETAICTLPAPSVAFHLSVMYDHITAVSPADLNQMSNDEKQVFSPIPSSTRPTLVLSAATTQGNAVVYHIPKSASTTKSTTTTMGDDKKKGKKDIKAQKQPPQRTTQIVTPNVTVHDPSISNYHVTLAKERSNLNELSGKNTTNRSAVSNSGTTTITKLLQEGSINDVYFIDMSQICVVRNSTLRPKIHLVQLLPQSSITPLSQFIQPPLPTPQTKSTSIFPQADGYLKVIAQWRGVIAVEKLRVSGNKDMELNRQQDKALFDVVKNATMNGNTRNIMLTTSQSTRTQVSTSSAMDDGDDSNAQSSHVNKRQKLLQHTSRLNSTLRNVLEANQDKIGPLALAPSYQPNKALQNVPFSAFASLQGTLCGVLVQALRSDDDQAIETVIKQGIQGLNSQQGWSTLIQYLNNPEALAQLDSNGQKTGFGNDGDDDDGVAFVPTIATITAPRLSGKQMNAGKTLIQTIRLLPQECIVPFMTVLTDKLAQNPLRSTELLPWIHVVLRLHSMYLLSVQDINDRLSQISNLLQQRTSTMNSMVQLKGRLEVIMTQFNASQLQMQKRLQDLRNKKTDNAKINTFLPLNVYSEDYDGSVFHSLSNEVNDDDEDDHGPNRRKRKAPVDNFAAIGISLDGSEYDDGYDEADEEGLDDDFFMGGEGEFDINMLGDDFFGAEGEFSVFEGDQFLAGGDDDDDDRGADVDDDMFDDDGDDFDLSDDDL